ncbi:hypothetical protein CL629_01805 [bacterium]|nr:hypothetical protein [bacterium]|tara:strand:- start:5297 stop:6559 length:1263 start_codon:yes stop_codon:yes gene_type:complete
MSERGFISIIVVAVVAVFVVGVGGVAFFGTSPSRVVLMETQNIQTRQEGMQREVFVPDSRLVHEPRQREVSVSYPTQIIEGGDVSLGNVFPQVDLISNAVSGVDAAKDVVQAVLPQVVLEEPIYEEPSVHVDSLAAQFSILESELLNAQSVGSNLSESHADRVLKDIAELEVQGYLISEVVRLRELVIQLSPHLQDYSESQVVEMPVESVSLPPQPPQETCVSNPNPVLTADITDMWRVSQITPPGVLMGGVQLKSHSYIWIEDGGTVPVYAPADVELVTGAYYLEGGISQYILIFRLSCEVDIKFDHILEPIVAIRDAFPDTPKGDTRTDPVGPISFKAGDVVGYTSGTPEAHNWDFGLYNDSVADPDANVPEAVGTDLRANCPYDYYSSDRRQTYFDLMGYSLLGGADPYVTYCDLQR